jgi:hypothetical protein
MAKRCRVSNAPKVIYSIKANAAFNSDAAVSLRDCLNRGKMRLLADEDNAREEFYSKYKDFYKLSSELQNELMMPFIQTTLLINEMVNLEADINNGILRLKEKSGNRKDRYSSVSYGNYFANVLERNLKKPNNNDLSNFKFPFRKPKIFR